MAQLSLPLRSGKNRLTSVVHVVAIIILLLRLSNWFYPSKTASAIDRRHRANIVDTNSIFPQAVRGSSHVKIFVYSLPPKFNSLQVARSRQQPPPIRDPYCDTNFYSAEVTIHRALMRSYARTKDPREADFFYVPLYVTCFLINNHPNNLTKTGMFFEEGMQYVQRMFPYFNASQGRDHIYTFTQGFGARLSGKEWKQWSNGIFLTHNGDFSSDEFTPRKDIVIPPDLSKYVKPIYTGTEKRNNFVLEQRRFLAMFGGQSFSSLIADHRGSNYSGGVRQYIATEMYRTPGFRITGTRSDSYLRDIRDSLFCLAPEGWHPWSPRPYYGLLSGCVPVVLSNRQELAFEDVVPYDEIVIWIRPEEVSSLNNILRSISVEDIERRLRIMERIWRLYSYDENEGAAMDAIFSELYRRKYFSRPRRRYWV